MNSEALKMKNVFTVECRGADGNLKWVERIENLVTTEGKNQLLDACFTAAVGSTNFYLGLKGNGAPAAGDTMASHAGWAELTPYSDANRPAWTRNGAAAAAALSNSASVAQFHINAGATVYGCFLTNDNTKAGAVGKLFSAGDFTNGSRNLVNGDVLTVRYDVSIT
jgi:hypothetical protein